MHKMKLDQCVSLADLDELWALVDYFTWGSLLGTRRTFNREIGDLIVAGRDKSALPEDMRRGEAAASRLMHLLRPHLLRREKEVLRLQATMNDKRPQGDLGSLTAGIARMALAPPTAAMGAMGRKKEVVVWCTMPPPQVRSSLSACARALSPHSISNRLKPTSLFWILRGFLWSWVVKNAAH